MASAPITMSVQQPHTPYPKPSGFDSIGLPTPSSLPRRRLGPHRGQSASTSPAGSQPEPRTSDEDEDEDGMEESPAEDVGDYPEPTLFFLEDVDMASSSPPSDAATDLDSLPSRLASAVAPLPVSPHQEQNGPTHHQNSSPRRAFTALPSGPRPFSSQEPIRRPFRSRYSVMDEEMSDASAPVSPSDLAWDLPPTPSFKRTFEEVTPSSGSTPPHDSAPTLPPLPASDASFSPFTTATATSPRPPASRHSFESQRAVASSNLRTRFLREHDSSTLRRRSPISSRSGSRDRTHEAAAASSGDDSSGTYNLGAPLDRSKRRRSGTIPDLAQDLMDRLDSEEAPSSGTSFANSRALPSGRFPPSRFPLDPTLAAAPTQAGAATGSPSDDLPPIRRSRLSLPSLSLLPASVRSPSSSPRIADDPAFSALRTTQNQPSETPASGADRPRRSTSSSFPSFASFRRATSTSYRVAPTVAVGGSSASGSSSAIEPAAIGTTLLRPRSARARPDVARERQFDPLVAFWREELANERDANVVERRGRAILDEAHERLSAAETTLRETARIFPGEAPTERSSEQDIMDSVAGRLEAADESIARTTRLLERFPAVPRDATSEDALPELPSSQHLLHPARSNEGRPVVGVRIGESWSPRMRSSTDLQRDVEPSPPSSPQGDDSALGNSASRALNFISSLRSRRPRLSRNSTGVPAPELSPNVSPNPQDADLESGGIWALPRQTPVPWDDAAEQVEAERLNQRLLATRAANEWPHALREQLPPAEGRLWGQVDSDSRFSPSSLYNRRMRGPTERSNELWRLGQQPEAAATGTTPARSFAPSLANPRQTPAPRLIPRDDAPAPPRENLWSENWFGRLPEREESPFRDPASPSPPRPRRGPRDPELDFLALERPFRLWDEQEARTPAEEAGRRPPRALFPSDTPQFRGLSERSSIRLPPIARPPPTTTRTRIFGEDLPDEPLPDRAFAFPSNLPPMLPQGSSGRRFGAQRDGPYGPEPGEMTRQRASTFGFDSTRYTPPTSRRTFAAPPAPSEPLGNGPSLAHRRRTTLTDALAHFGARGANADAPPLDATLRRRHTGTDADSRAATDATETSERFAQRQVRTERLASLRRERILIQSMMGGPRDVEAGEEGARLVPRSPGGRMRGIGAFLFGGGGRFASLFDSDEDFGAFFGRESAALDPRNYLDDDDFDTSYESLIRLQERLGDVKPKGVSADRLSALKQFKYKDWPFPPRKEVVVRVEVTSSSPIATTSAVTMDVEEPPALARRGLEKEERCSVCLQDYLEDDDCVLGLCSHGFHLDCLSAWLKEHAACPVCRRDHA